MADPFFSAHVHVSPHKRFYIYMYIGTSLMIVSSRPVSVVPAAGSRETRPSGSTRRFASNRPWPGIIARNYTFRVPVYIRPTRTCRFTRYHGEPYTCHPRAITSAWLLYYIVHIYLGQSFRTTLQFDDRARDSIQRFKPRKRLVENWSASLPLYGVCVCVRASVYGTCRKLELLTNQRGR